MNKLLLIIVLSFSAMVAAQKPLPNVDVVTLDGKKVKLENELNKDKVSVISFWATWCVPCINELDAISEIYDDWQDETGVEIIAVSVDDARTQKRIKPMVNGKDWPYKVLIDKNQDLKRSLNISVVPHVLIVKNGKIVHRHTGYTPGAEEELYERIQKYAK